MTIRIYFLAKYIVIISTQVQMFLFHMRYLGIQQLEVRRRNFARKTLQREEEVGCAACAAVPKLFPQTSALMSYEISLLCFNPSLGDPYHRRPESDVFSMMVHDCFYAFVTCGLGNDWLWSVSTGGLSCLKPPSTVAHAMSTLQTRGSNWRILLLYLE